MERTEAIEKLREGIRSGSREKCRTIDDKYDRINAIRLLMVYLNEEVEDKRNETLNGLIEDDKIKEIDEIAKLLIVEGTKFASESKDKEKLVRVVEFIKEGYQVRGRRHFEDFLIAVEWNYNWENKPYEIRKNVLREWVEWLEDLEYGRLKVLSISAPPRTGKALSLDSKVLTPKGWKEMRDIHEGDEVIGADGKSCNVLGVFPQGITDLYRVTFDDNTSVKCSGDHLWEVQTRDDRCCGKKRIVKTTDMIKNVMVENCTRRNYSIDYVEPVEFENTLEEDDLHPYLLGILIGDGGLHGHTFTSKDKEIVDRFRKLMPKTDKLTYKSNYDYTYAKKEDTRNSKGYIIKSTITKKLEEYGLEKTKSTNKFIPKKYLYSSIENRIELLRGLMDTDGYCGGAINEFCTTSKQLSEDVTELARSLGGRVTIGEKIGKYKDKNGKIVECNKAYRLYIKMPINPFYLKRKAEKCITREKHIRKYKYIAKIEKIPDEETQCIYVDNESHLFVTDGYNITHNTFLGVRYFVWCMLRHPDRSCFFVSHTAAMASKVYSDVISTIEESKNEITKIFPRGKIVQRNAEQNFIRLDNDSGNPYHTAYFRGIDGNMARSIGS